MRFEVVNIENGRDPQFPKLPGQHGGGVRRGGGVTFMRRTDNAIESFPQGGKFTFHVDDDLLDTGCRLLQQTAQRPRFTASGIGLDQHPRFEQAGHVHGDIGVSRFSQGDRLHASAVARSEGKDNYPELAILGNSALAALKPHT